MNSIRGNGVRGWRVLPVLSLSTAVCVVPIACGAGARGNPPGRPGAADCAIHESSRRVITTEAGDYVHVLPEAMAASNSTVIVVGGSSGLSSASGGSGAARVVRDSIVGFVVLPQGTVEVIPRPLEGSRLIGFRAAALGGNRWSVVFGEARDTSPDASDAFAERLWSGVLHGGSWEALEPIAIPPGYAVEPGASSSLVAWADSLAWVMRASHRSRADAMVAFLHGEDWSFRPIDAPHVAGVEAAHSPVDGVLVVAIHEDTAEETGTRSLYLYGQPPEWRLIRKLATGSPTYLQRQPALRWNGMPPVVVTWQEYTMHPIDLVNVKAIVDPLTAVAPPHTLATAVSTAVVVGAENVLTTVEPRRDLSRMPVHFRSLDGRSLGVIDSAFIAGFKATADAAGTIALAGPVIAPNGPPATQVITATVTCR